MAVASYDDRVNASGELAAVRERHPDVFARSWKQRYGGALLGLATIIYLAFTWAFFEGNRVLVDARWDRAGNYLADWVTWEARPEIRFADEAPGGTLEVRWPRFSPLGADPDPEWFEVTGREDAADVVAVAFGPDASLVFTGEAVTVTKGGAETVLERGPDGVPIIPEGAPSFITPGRNKAFVAFGSAGRVEIRDDKAKLFRRFWGWENFLFDPRSEFWGRPVTETLGLIVSGERLDPAQSNLAMAANDFWYNAEWQHGDVYTKLLQTVVMAFVGTLFAAILAFPLSFMAARNVTPSLFLNQALKRGFDFLRCVDMLIWALFFTRAFGPGPLAGISAIFFTDTGTLGKLYAEALENVDDRQREGLRSVGAPPSAVQRFGIVPQVAPVFLSQALYFWESNTRSATIIGAVGAGGIGLKLWEAMRTNSDWENVAYMVLLILLVVFTFDNVSNALRKRLIGGARA